MTARLALLAAVAVLLVPVGALFVFALRAEAWTPAAGMVAAFALGAGLAAALGKWEEGGE